MPRFPYMNFPFPYYNNKPLSKAYNPSSFSNGSLADKTSTTFSLDCTKPQASQQHLEFQNDLALSSSNSSSVSNRFVDKKNKSNNSNDDYLFDLFGLKIYTDDVLLVSLIYFLYSEGVKDEGLFIVLILLLLS